MQLIIMKLSEKDEMTDLVKEEADSIKKILLDKLDDRGQTTFHQSSSADELFRKKLRQLCNGGVSQVNPRAGKLEALCQSKRRAS
jgi:hypothetical protein